jgi:hypothetical protein
MSSRFLHPAIPGIAAKLLNALRKLTPRLRFADLTSVVLTDTMASPTKGNQMSNQSININHLPLLSRADANLRREAQSRDAMAFYHQQVAAAVARKAQRKNKSS